MSKTPEEMAEDHANMRCPEQGPEFIVWCMCKDDFLTGYKAAQDQLADADKVMPDTCEHILDMGKMVDVNGWISVKDRLPEGGEFVSCFGRAAYENGLSVTQGCYNKWGQWHSCEWDGCGGYEYLVEVTHWMPLPEPPKEEK